MMTAMINAGAAAQAPVLSSGIHSMTLQRAGAPPVHYAISIPAASATSSLVPLVLALHFSANPQGAGRAVLEILVQPALAELGAIIVAPDSLGGDWQSSDNDRAVNDLLDAVIKSYKIDTKKIVVTGFSMGGRGTWYFGEKYPNRFSAAIPVAGFPPQWPRAGGCPCWPSIPAMMRLHRLRRPRRGSRNFEQMELARD